ncbi:DapH/DapD/GlmU-related protein, partial [Vibrio parahaemolyticus]|uniref:DapH/DapD/GlmU-related protein n=1 Tax=Vibrio parahaemolyticus TaxID=670 RepID=UPI001166B5D5
MKYNENKEFGVTIGAGTRICANTVVVGNVTIGKNCVIGANSIITKSIPDNSVVVGANKIIRTNSMLFLWSNRKAPLIPSNTRHRALVKHRYHHA